MATSRSRLHDWLATLKAKVDRHIARQDRLLAATADDAFDNLRLLAIDSDAARRAAEAASGALFRDEALPQIGSEVWQALWESARAFSEQEAYLGQRFPVTEPGSVCVLC